MIWHVYLITCDAVGADFGKQYVGITSTNVYVRFGLHFSFAKRGFNYPLSIAIRKYRDIDFVIEHLCSCLTKEDALALEAAFVAEYQTIEPCGFNAGGRGVPLKPERAKQMSDRLNEPAHRAMQTQAAIKYWSDPQNRRAQSNKRREYLNSDPKLREANRQQLLDAVQKRGRGPGSRLGRTTSFSRDPRQRPLL